MIAKIILSQILTIVLTIAAYSQDTTWFSKESKKVPGKESASTYNVVFKDKADTNKVKQLSFTVSDTLQVERNFYPYYPKPVSNGFYRVYEEGQLVEERFYRNDSLHGHHRTYRKNGLLRRDDLYENDKLVSGKCFGHTGTDTVWFERVMPAKFPGGMDSLQRYMLRNIRYPYAAKKDQIEGRVIVSFIIVKDGSIVDVAVKNSVHPDLDKEAMRLVSNMPRWIPGTLEGEPVKFTYRLPVLFRLME